VLSAPRPSNRSECPSGSAVGEPALSSFLIDRRLVDSTLSIAISSRQLSTHTDESLRRKLRYKLVRKIIID
jgi:hypothetical protein